MASLYRRIVETSADGMWVMDADGRILHANAATAALLGTTVEDVVGATHHDFLDDAGKAQFAAHLARVRGGWFNEADVEVQLVRRDGTPQWALVSETPLRDDSGNLTGILHRITDYAQRRRMLEEVSASEERLAEAQRIAGIGSFTWDLRTDAVTGSAGLYLMLDVSPSASTYEDFIDGIHPEHHLHFARSVDAAREAGTDARFVVRCRGRTGWIWARVQAELVRDATGEVVTLSGTVQDVTETVEAERALKDRVAQNTLMQAVASAANEASSMAEVLVRLRALLLAHDDWERARGYTCDQDVPVPLYVDEQDREDDDADPEDRERDARLAARCAAARRPVWDESGLTIACPVMHADRVELVYIITSRPPIVRREMIEQMAQQVAVQVGRVAEREAAARVLAEARDAAEAASRQKSEFLAMISHEIRTPLNGVLGLNELLTRTDLDAEQRRLVSGVELSGRALLGLINEILDYSKVEAGHLELEAVDFDVRSVVEAAVEPLLASGRSKGLEVRFGCTADVPSVASGDPVRLTQVLSNLVSNAVKFTHHGSVTVEVDSTPVDGGWLLRADVRDTGVGTDVDAETLFAPFQQADTSTTRVFGGTGLGLAISREIVAAYGGTMGFDSTPGQGTHIWFTARLSPSAGGPVVGVTERRRPAFAPADGERRHVLVVEDNPVNQMVAVGLLHSLGYAAETADDGVAALTVFDAARHELVLMDVQMPRMDGLEATRRLRERLAGGPRVPIIAMTAAAVRGERERCLEAGMDDFLTKPVDPELLARTMESWLGARPGSDSPAAPAERDSEEVEGGRGVVDGVDLGRLDMLRDMDPGCTAYLERALANFAAAVEGHLAALRTAVVAADVDALRFAAHRLAGSAANLGLQAASRAVRELELLADTGTTEGAEALLPAAEREVCRGREALRRYEAAHLRPVQGAGH